MINWIPENTFDSAMGGPGLSSTAAVPRKIIIFQATGHELVKFSVKPMSKVCSSQFPYQISVSLTMKTEDE